MSAPPARTALADTYPNPSNAVFRTGIGALWDYVTERLGLSGTAADARTALGIGPNISYRNRVTNSRFIGNVRSVTGTVTLAAGAYGHDGWKAGAAGCTYTFATSGADVVLTISAGSLIHTIDGVNIEGGSYIMSWFGTSQGKIAAGAAAVSPVAAVGVTAGANLAIEFGTGTLSRVQLEAGTASTPYERRNKADEIMACRSLVRLVQIEIQNSGAAGQQVLHRAYWEPMRAAPSLVSFGTPSYTNVTSETTTRIQDGGFTYGIVVVASAGYIAQRQYIATAEL